MNAYVNGSPDRLPVIAESAAGPVAAYGAALPITHISESTESQTRILLLRLLSLFLKHKLTILAFLVVSLVCGFVVTFLTTPLYRAVTTIQIDRDPPKVVYVSKQGGDESGNDPTFLQTQIELLKSRSLAERIATNLDLGQTADQPAKRSSILGSIFGSRPEKETSAADLGAMRNAVVGRILGGLDVKPVPYSRLVSISFTDADPHWAQNVSNAVAENFIGATIDRRFGATAYTRQFLEERLQQLKAKIEESEKQVVSYAQREGIVNVNDKMPQASATLAAINQALTNATAERLKAEQLSIQADSSSGLGLPQIMNDPAIQEARKKRAQLSADYQDKLTNLKPAFPEMVQLKSQISEIDRQIKTQVGLVKESIRSQYEAAKSQEASFAAKSEEMKAQVLDERGRSVEYQMLQREADTNRALYDGLLQQYKEAGVSASASASNVSVVDKAQLPVTPVRPILLMNLAIAIVLGLAAATITVFVLEALDDTFKTPEDVEDGLGLAVLGVTPKIADLVISDALKIRTSPIAEAYRSVRTALQFATEKGAPKTLLVTSSRPGEGKSTTSMSIAAHFGQLGIKVLLIDADLRKPSMHRVLSADNAIGLSNYLCGGDDPSDFAQQTQLENVTFMSTGPLPPNPAELLASPAMVSLLASAAENFGIVIIDGPPVMGLADAPILSSLTEATVLVIEAGGTRRGLVRAAVKRLHFARGRICGALLNKFDYKKAGHTYGYGYGYGYGGTDYFTYGSSQAAQLPGK